MHNNKEYKSNNETNECTARGICSVSPTVAAMQELIILFLVQISNYILKLEKLGGNNKNMLIKMINDIASLNIVNSINEKRLYDILIRNYQLLKDVEKTYIDFCNNNKINYKTLKLPFDFDENLPFSKVISLGERLSFTNYKKHKGDQKNYIDILFVIIKSVCENLSQLIDFKTYFKEGYQAVLEALNILNNEECSEKQLKDSINKLALMDNKLSNALSQNLFENFGQISKVEVSHSTRPGKAILVSGSNYMDLYNILEITKDRDIDVYTHSNLLIAHSLEKFRQYKNLIGHYGTNTDSCIVDYGTFPGAILLTKGERNSNEYFYRGRLFSNDYFANSGIIEVKDNNYAPVIDAANNSKGFVKGKHKDTSIIGYDESEIWKHFENINKKLETGEIKHLYIIGLNPYSEKQKEYFNELFEHLEPDEYAISFFYRSKKKNILTINIGNYAPFAVILLEKLFENKKINKNVTFIYTQCDAMTISGIITLKMHGAESIYIANCMPTLINPSVLGTFLTNYNVKITNNAIHDLHEIRKK